MEDGANPRRWKAFGVCVAGAALSVLDLTKVNVAVPSLETRLGASPVELQLVIAAYAVAFGLVLVPSGRLGDLGARKPLFLIGLVLFGAASLLCGLAPSASALVSFRALQGVAAGILMPQVIGFIQHLFPPAERGRAFGLFGGITGFLTALGPVLGGVLIELGGTQLGWRMTFWINVPLLLALLPFAATLLPRTAPTVAHRMTIDVVGVMLFGASVTLLMIPFVLTSGRGGDDSARWWALLGCAVALVAFLCWERSYSARGNDPLIDLSLLRIETYRYSLLVGSIYYAGMPAVFIVVTLFLQQGLGVPAGLAGLAVVPFPLASALAAVGIARLLPTWSRELVWAGLGIATGGFLLVLAASSALPAGSVTWGMSAALALAGIGGGIVAAANQTRMLQHVPIARGGVAGAFGQVGQRTGTAIGVAAVVSSYFSTLAGIDDGSRLEGYRSAVSGGLAVAVGFFAVALAVSLLDRQRSPEQRRGTTPEV